MLRFGVLVGKSNIGYSLAFQELFQDHQRTDVYIFKDFEELGKSRGHVIRSNYNLSSTWFFLPC